MSAARKGLLAAVAAIALVCLTLPFAARGWFERRLAVASGLEARVGWLAPTWEPLGIALERVELRAAAEGAPLLSVARLEVPFRGGRLRALGPALSLRGLGAEAGGTRAAPAAVRRFALADTEVRGAVLEVGSAGVPGTAPTSVLLPDAFVERLDGDVSADGGITATGRLEVAGGVVDGRVRLRADPAPGIAADLRLTAVSLERLGSLPPRGLTAGEIGGRLRYRGAADRGAGRLRGHLSARGLRGADEARGRRFEVGELELRGLDVDLAARRFAARAAALAGGELVLAKARDPAAAPEPSPVWSVSAGTLDARDIVVRSEEVPDLPALRVVRLAGRDLGRAAGTFALEVQPTSGGTLRADGEIDAAAPRFRADVELERVAIGPWIEPFARRLRFASGSLAGRVEIAGPPGVRGSGELRLEDVRALALRGGEERELAGLGRLSASLRGFTLFPRRVWLESAEIEAPVLVLTRTSEGMEPLSLWTTDDAAEDEVAAREAFGRASELLGEAPPLSLPSIEVKARMQDGRVRFADETVAPPFAVELDRLSGTLGAWGGPPWGVVRAEVGGRVDGAEPIAARAEIGGPRFALAGEVTGLPLPRWNAYLAPTIGHAATAGRASAAFELEWERQVRAPIRLTLDGVELERGPGEDRIGAMLGMPLVHALELMADSDGRSELVLRLDGDPGAPALGLVAALPAALREAVPEAVSVPLFEGAEVVGAEDAGHVRLAPLRFPAGTAEIPPQASEPLERLAVVLRWDPVLVASVQGFSGAEDAAALAAGAGGEPLERLALRRAEAVRARLVETHGVAADRVLLAPAANGAPGARVDVRPGEEPS